MKSFNTLSDVELIDSMRQGIPEAGEAIYQRYHPRVLKCCCYCMHSMEDGQDAAQEVFFKVLVLKKIFDFRGDSSFWTWLRRVVINVCKEIIRRLSKIREVCLKPAEDGLSPLEEVIAARGPNPEERVIRDTENTHVRIVVNQLPKKYGEAISVAYFEDLTYAEAARRLNLTIQSLGVRLLRGRRMMLRLVKQRICLGRMGRETLCSRSA